MIVFQAKVGFVCSGYYYSMASVPTLQLSSNYDLLPLDIFFLAMELIICLI